MKFCRDTFEVEIEVHKHNGKERGFANLNSVILGAIRNWGIRQGMGVVRSKHTTAGIIEQEDEKGILYFDMPQLIELALQKKLRVVPFMLHEYWMDVGAPLDYQQANEDYRKHFEE